MVYEASLACVSFIYLLPSDWAEFVKLQFIKWVEFHNFWITRALNYDLDLFILFYEDLLEVLPRALANTAYFLGLSVDADTLKCVQENSEGQYHRKSQSPARDPFTDLKKYPLEMDRLKSILNEMIQQCSAAGKCVTSGRTRLPLTAS